jgi:hypothetical protein
MNCELEAPAAAIARHKAAGRWRAIANLVV